MGASTAQWRCNCSFIDSRRNTNLVSIQLHLGKIIPYFPLVPCSGTQLFYQLDICIVRNAFKNGDHYAVVALSVFSLHLPSVYRAYFLTSSFLWIRCDNWSLTHGKNKFWFTTLLLAPSDGFVTSGSVRKDSTEENHLYFINKEGVYCFIQ